MCLCLVFDVYDLNLNLTFSLFLDPPSLRTAVTGRKTDVIVRLHDQFFNLHKVRSIVFDNLFIYLSLISLISRISYTFSIVYIINFD